MRPFSETKILEAFEVVVVVGVVDILCVIVTFVEVRAVEEVRTFEISNETW